MRPNFWRNQKSTKKNLSYVIFQGEQSMTENGVFLVFSLNWTFLFRAEDFSCQSERVWCLNVRVFWRAKWVFDGWKIVTKTHLFKVPQERVTTMTARFASKHSRLFGLKNFLLGSSKTGKISMCRMESVRRECDPYFARAILLLVLMQLTWVRV